MMHSPPFPQAKKDPEVIRHSTEEKQPAYVIRCQHPRRTSPLNDVLLADIETAFVRARKGRFVSTGYDRVDRGILE